TQRIVTGYQIKSLSNVHKKIRKQVSVSGFLHSHWIGQLILNWSALLRNEPFIFSTHILEAVL
ncbi:hypothetical protein JYK11_14585, partial [Shigella dysenteriae]|nr:hypothetical protein [Shigella dysenteriae]